MSLWRYANPAEFMRVSGAALPALTALTAVALAVGLGWGFFLTPDDYQQGASVKILFVHVPAALMAINAWLMMLVASLIWFVRRHHVSALAARAAAPVGATMTLIALADRRDLGPADVGHLVGLGPAADLVLRALPVLPRLHRALGGGRGPRPRRRPDRAALPRRLGLRAACRATRCSSGARGCTRAPSLSLDAQENVDDAFWWPLVVSIAGFVLLFVALVLRAHPHRDPRPPAAARSRWRRRGHDPRPRPLRRDRARRLRRHPRRCSPASSPSASGARARVRRRLAVLEARRADHGR